MNEGEEYVARIYDVLNHEFTSFVVTHQKIGSGHKFRIRSGNTVVMEVGGLEHGVTLTSLLQKWEKQNEKTSSV